MINFNADQFNNASQNAAAELSALAQTAFAGFEKLTEFNLATTKAALTQTLDSLQAVAQAKTPQDVLAVQSSLVKPLAEKAAAYSRNVYAIASETSSELSKASEGKLAELQKTVGSAFESLAKNATAGSETWVAAFKNAATTGQQVMDSAQAAAKQALAQAEANVSDVVAKATAATK
ncbi:MAG: phasin family protein [Burkholderiaceae bacterium]|nr:phasin family protein [Burkholderiaceae bacterium]